MVLETRFFNFSFLPEFDVTKPTMLLTVNREHKTEVTIEGNVTIRDIPFECQMVKPFNKTYYSTKLRSDSEVDYYTLNHYIVKAVSIVEGPILPSDSFSKARLESFHIEEEDILIVSPRIEIALSPFP